MRTKRTKRIRGWSTPALIAAAILCLPPAIAATPTGLLAQEKLQEPKQDAAALYDACMDKAEATLAHCLDHAVESELLCWAAYGYNKLGCTISYAVRIIVR
jgi:hypothetical protein